MTAVALLPLIILLGLAHAKELNDPFVGEAIRREVGTRYVVLSYFAIISGLDLITLGTIQGLALRRSAAK